MHYPASELVIDPVLIRSHDVSGPRYTSYPTADRFVEAFGELQLRQWLAKRNIGGFSQPLSLYVVTPDHGRSAKYIQYLEKELALLAPLVGESRAIRAMHWGGGTPTFLSRDEMRALMRAVEAVFARDRKTEYSIEVDPRSAEPGRMALLATLGFNHVSLGVQGLDPATRRVMAEARASGFASVNFDLIYGLPKQTLDSFNRTLDEVLLLDPERIALYAGPELPSAERKLQLLTLAVGRLTRAGYLYIGMDHFAKPDDELAVAQAHGQLARGFQGYSTHAGDLIGVGTSAIGQVGPTYYQNAQELARYYAALDAGGLPVLRGLELTADDLVRRAVIQALMCQFRVSIEAIELSHLVEFTEYFSEELNELRRYADDGLVELQPDSIVVTPKGRLLVRAICMVFDRYLRSAREGASRSRII